MKASADSGRRLCVGLALVASLAAAGCSGSAKTPPQEAPDAAEVAGWPTWVLKAPDRVPVPPPPAARSAAGRADTAQLARLAGSAPPAAKELVRRWRHRSAIEPWTDLNLALVAGAEIDPPSAARAYALTSVAMYDAVVSARYWQRRHRRRSYPSERAAVAGAASRVLAYLFPRRSAAGLDRMAEQAARSGVLRGASYPSDVRAGLALGRAVAARVIARARRDGSQRRWRGQRPRGPAHWAPPLGTAARPAAPLAGTWRTWVLKSGSELRPPPPPRFGSPRYVAEARELMRLREALTPERRRIAQFWDGGVSSPLPPGVWNHVALAYARRDRLGTASSARLFALLNVAMADAGVATWDSKYAYWSARPENAIRDLGLDRRWRSFIPTPAFPSYVSAHSAFSGAAQEVLAALFPHDARQFARKAVQAGLSRLHGGIHFRFDHVEGLSLGRRVGRLVVACWAGPTSSPPRSRGSCRSGGRSRPPRS